MAEKNLNLCVLYDFYGNMLTDKQREVFEFYYSEDLSLAEIAEHTGITRQGVRDSIKHAEASLLDMEEKIGAIKRTKELDIGLNTIKELASEVERISRRDGSSLEISMLVKKILELADRLSE